MINFWDFKAWGGFNVISVLLVSLLAASMLKRAFPILKASLIPTSVLGGGLLIIVAGIYKAITGDIMFDTAFFGGNGTATLELLTYHTLALGFIASTFKPAQEKMTKKRTIEIFNTGVTTVATYLLQAVVGMGITMIAVFVMDDFFGAAGILLPFGFGQGTGQALNYGGIYEADFGFEGGRSFGLTIAALGFLSASIGGVIHLNILRKKGKIRPKDPHAKQILAGQIQSEDESRQWGIFQFGCRSKYTMIHQQFIQCGQFFIAGAVKQRLQIILQLSAGSIFLQCLLIDCQHGGTRRLKCRSSFFK